MCAVAGLYFYRIFSLPERRRRQPLGRPSLQMRTLPPRLLTSRKKEPCQGLAASLPRKTGISQEPFRLYIGETTSTFPLGQKRALLRDFSGKIQGSDVAVIRQRVIRSAHLPDTKSSSKSTRQRFPYPDLIVYEKSGASAFSNVFLK